MTQKTLNGPAVQDNKPAPNPNPPNLDPAPPEHQKAATELLRTYLEIYDGYHNDKETLIVAFVVFYLGGATAMLGLDKPFWKASQSATVLTFVLAVSALTLALSFVLWLFRLRRRAGDIYQACTLVLTEWTVRAPTVNDLEPVLWGGETPLLSGFKWPRALFTTLDTIRTQSRQWWAPREMTWIPMVLWTLAVLWRIVTQ